MLTIHFAATLFMTGVIWIVQIVTYPQLYLVSKSDFSQYEKSHMRRIGFVVGPIMLLEFFSALYLLVQGGVSEGGIILFYLSIGLGVIIGLSTAIFQAPIHVQLAADGKDDDKINKLINTNWIRTIAWSGRAMLIGYIVYLSF